MASETFADDIASLAFKALLGTCRRKQKRVKQCIATVLQLLQAVLPLLTTESTFNHFLSHLISPSGVSSQAKVIAEARREANVWMVVKVRVEVKVVEVVVSFALHWHLGPIL